MKPIFFFRVVAICAALVLLGTISMNAAQPQASRQVLDADSGWRFLLGDPSGAEARQFADGSWRTVNLPHDWSIEGVPDKDNPSAAGGGFYPGGSHMTLAKWMDRLDEVCTTDFDMEIHDLPDNRFRDAYLRGFSPEEFRAVHALPQLSVTRMDTSRKRSIPTLNSRIPLARHTRRSPILSAC